MQRPAAKDVGGRSRKDETAPSRGRFINTGNGPTLQPIDIGHSDYMALIDPDTAFWSLVRKDQVGEVLSGGPFDLAQGRPEETRMGGKLLADYRRKADAFAAEMQKLRFGLKPSAVYFNPTERCNLDCRYCYIPREMRRHGEHMSRERLLEAMARLDSYFEATLPKTMRPQIVFHGAEPMLNREAVFAGDRGVSRAVPLRHPDERHPARRGGRLVPDGPGRQPGTFARCRQPGRRPAHAPHLGWKRRLRYRREGHAAAARLRELERDLHGHQGEPAAPGRPGGLLPRRGGPDVPAEYRPLHAAALARESSPATPKRPGTSSGRWSAATNSIARRGGNWSWPISRTSCWASWRRRRAG